ncbi:MAG: THUMP domain-containing class I SAM-dependent RNA methyltransferase [Bacteroidota bacterium]
MGSEQMNTPMIAKTVQGLEKVLAAELENLGASEITPVKRAVTFKGNKSLLYQSNLHLRTALSVLVPVDSFEAGNPDELYEEALKTDWTSLFNPEQTFYISHSINSPHFSHSQYAALKLKDAICDQFRKSNVKRPSVDTENPDIRINLHIYGTTVTLSLDSSGEPLFKRGYRQRQATAPLNEVLAAGIIKLTGWDYQSNFIDPMCGSGTFCIEAAMMALDIAPGLLRHRFAFMNWKNFDAALWKELTEEAKRKKQKELPVKIIGSDIDPNIIAKAERNASFIRSNQLRFASRDFFDFELPAGKNLVVFNPPYGIRLESDDLSGFYRNIGTTLKHKFTGTEVWMISPEHEALKEIGLKPSARYTVFNGPLECRLQKFELYTGSKKQKTQAEV